MLITKHVRSQSIVYNLSQMCTMKSGRLVFYVRHIFNAFAWFFVIGIVRKLDEFGLNIYLKSHVEGKRENFVRKP